MKRLVIILFLVSVSYGDVYTSHQLPHTDSSLDIGSATYLWRFIYADIFTDGTAYWESSQLYGFDEIDADSIVALVDLYGETITGHELTVSHIIGLEDITGDEIFGTTITGTTITDGTFIVSGGEISAGEIINTFGDIDIGGNTLTSWDILTGQIIAHSTTDPQLLLRHTTGVDEAGFYVDSDGDLTIAPTGSNLTIQGSGAVFTAVGVGTVDTVRGILSLRGHATGQTQGGILRLDTSDDHDAAINYYYIQVSSDDLLIGPSTDLDSLKYDGGTGVWTFSVPMSVNSDVPANVTSAGTAGTITYDADHIYVAIANNSWKRVALSTWGVTGDTMIYEDDNTMVFEDGNTMVYD